MKSIFTLLAVMPFAAACAQSAESLSAPADTIATIEGAHLEGVEITSRRKGITRMKGAVNGQLINKEELFKAACCNLGESFVTNPSVDVHYSDAATGAQQIRLLGLSGKYVQMLTENLPDFRGASIPYSLDYVPGPWMQSIQVSKGNASVRNGYEAMTGQINVEYLKPEADEGVTVNLYGSSEGAVETNADANVHINGRLSTELLGHFQNIWNRHDDDGDGFQQMVKVKQYNFQNRWAYLGEKYIFHGGVQVLDEERASGQVTHTRNDAQEPLFRIGIKTDRYSAYMKHALVFNRERNTSMAFMASGSMHETDACYGRKTYGVNEKNVYAQLIFETDFTGMHNLSVGASLNHDFLDQRFRLTHDATAAQERLVEKETTPGVYAQYTFNYNHLLTAMAGLRIDNSSCYGTFVTPRLHLKWQPNGIVGFRASAGKGYRTAHAFAEYNYLMSSGRQFTVSNDLKQESAWNYGISAALNIPLGQRTMTVNAEYFYTHFANQVDVDYDADPALLIIGNIKGKSHSHTLQVDATYEVFRGMSVTAAFRRSIVKAMYGGEMTERPLQGRYKGLLTASYKTPLGLWQFDATLQLNGDGRMPRPYILADGTPSWDATFKAYEQVTAQVTRWFRHFSVYVGSENITGFMQKTPVYDAANPWGSTFDPTLVWAPTDGRMFYAGIRINIGRL